MKKILHSSSGETLVEIIIGVLILAIASVCLVSGFVTSSNIINRATLIKNYSTAAASLVELEGGNYVIDDELKANLDLSPQENVGKITFTAQRKSSSGGHNVGSPITIEVLNGKMTIVKETKYTNLVYKEFFPAGFLEKTEENP